MSMAQIEPSVQSTSGRVVWGRIGVRREARDVDGGEQRRREEGEEGRMSVRVKGR